MPHACPIQRREYSAAYRSKNREKLLEAQKRRWHNIYKFQNEHNRGQRRKRRYGITNAEWDALFEKQGGLCALCKSKPPVDTDHDHATGKIRGLLCRSCNVGLGQLGDNIEGLKRAIEYLEG